MRLLLLLLCLAEVLLVTWCRNIAGPYISPLLLLGTSIAMGVVYLRIANAPIAAPTAATGPLLNRRVLLLLQLLPFLLLSYLIFKTNKTIWWWQTTIDSGVDRSDIIPQITTLVQRMLHDEQPYYPIAYTGYTLYPTYLPLQWLPYTLTELLHKDYRWIPVIALWLATLYFFIRHRRLQGHPALQVLLPVLPLAAWYALVMYDNDMFKLTVEGLVAGYYLFTATSIGGRRTLPLAMGIAACLLSRYSIIFWVPLCLACCYMAGRKKEAMIIAATALVAFIAVYWLPFLRRDPMIFLNGYRYHTAAAYGEWYNDLNTLHGKFYLYNGFGFTAWALRMVPGDLHQTLTLYQRTHLVLCTATVCLLGVYYWRHRHAITLQSFLLCSFKIYLAVFYAFIQIPYKYLFLVPIVISATLVAEAFNKQVPIDTA